jgi:hypothetical protein
MVESALGLKPVNHRVNVSHDFRLKNKMNLNFLFFTNKDRDYKISFAQWWANKFYEAVALRYFRYW